MSFQCLKNYFILTGSVILSPFTNYVTFLTFFWNGNKKTLPPLVKVLCSTSAVVPSSFSWHLPYAPHKPVAFHSLACTRLHTCVWSKFTEPGRPASLIRINYLLNTILVSITTLITTLFEFLSGLCLHL